jgi:hypothetical protein
MKAGCIRCIVSDTPSVLGRNNSKTHSEHSRPVQNSARAQQVYVDASVSALRDQLLRRRAALRSLHCSRPLVVTDVEVHTACVSWKGLYHSIHNERCSDLIICTSALRMPQRSKHWPFLTSWKIQKTKFSVCVKLKPCLGGGAWLARFRAFPVAKMYSGSCAPPKRQHVGNITNAEPLATAVSWLRASSWHNL